MLLKKEEDPSISFWFNAPRGGGKVEAEGPEEGPRVTVAMRVNVMTWPSEVVRNIVVDVLVSLFDQRSPSVERRIEQQEATH